VSAKASGNDPIAQNRAGRDEADNDGQQKRRESQRNQKNADNGDRQQHKQGRDHQRRQNAQKECFEPVCSDGIGHHGQAAGNEQRHNQRNHQDDGEKTNGDYI